MGLEEKIAYIWHLYSSKFEIVGTIKKGGVHSHQNPIYTFFETLIDKIRPIIREGTRSIVIVTPPKSEIFNIFLLHIKDHHQWLINPKSQNKVSLTNIIGKARDRKDIELLRQNPDFASVLSDSIGDEYANLAAIFHKRFNSPETHEGFFFLMNEIEEVVDSERIGLDFEPEYILLSDQFWISHKTQRKVQQLLDRAKNKGFKIKILNKNEDFGKKVQDFGGIVCTIKPKL